MVEVEIDRKRKLVIERFRGTVALEDIADLKTAKDISVGKGYYPRLLIDIRFANLESITESQMDRNIILKEFVDAVADYNCLVVVGSINQLFSELGYEIRDHFKGNLKAFTNYEDALNWYDNNEKALNCE